MEKDSFWCFIFTNVNEKAALSKGKLSGASKARISEILKAITPESNDVILLAPLKR